MNVVMKRVAVAAMLLSLVDRQINAAEAAVENICVYHMESIGADPRVDPLKGVVFPTVPAEARSESSREVPATFMVMDNLPRTSDEYRLIYPHEKKVSTVSMSEINYVQTHSKFDPMTALPGKKLSDTFDEEIKTRPESVVILIGHNDGRFFRFRDGSVDTIGDMALACARVGKICVFVSCRSKLFLNPSDPAIGVVHDLSYGEAMKVSNKVQKYVQAKMGDVVSVDALGAYLSKQESRTKLRTSVAYLIVKACHVAAPIIAVAIVIRYLEQCDNSDPKCPA
jgi:hypothetical protein